MLDTGSVDHCSKDALTGFTGWLLQGVLAGLAFTCLIGKLTQNVNFSSQFCCHSHVDRMYQRVSTVKMRMTKTLLIGPLIAIDLFLYFFSEAKRFREPPNVRRSWETWWYDTSKQGIGAIIIHMTNVYLAPLLQGDPCTWYVINFLLDSTIGLLIVFIGIRLCQFLAYHKKWPAINFGVYGNIICRLSGSRRSHTAFHSLDSAPFQMHQDRGSIKRAFTLA